MPGLPDIFFLQLEVNVKLEAMIFDLDGTIADTVPLTIYSLKKTARQLTGKEYSDDYILKLFGPIDSEIIKGLVNNHNREAAVEVYFTCFRENFHRFVKPMDGIEELLKHLKSKSVRTGMFTGRSRRGTDIVLEELKLREYFDVIIPGDFIENPKPDPEGIWNAMDYLRVEGRAAAYVGDMEVDVLAGKNAGVFSILALWSTTADKGLIHTHPDKYFWSPRELIQWLESES